MLAVYLITIAAWLLQKFPFIALAFIIYNRTWKAFILDTAKGCRKKKNGSRAAFQPLYSLSFYNQEHYKSLKLKAILKDHSVIYLAS